jgi:hypothetical protein
MEQASLAGLLQFLAQVANVNLQHVAFAPEIIPPYPVEDDFAGEYLARMPQEKLKGRSWQ